MASPGNTDTIAAVATAAGMAGVGIVRVSGPAALAIAATLVGRTPRPRYAHFARLCDARGDPIDAGVVLVFPAPHSYTGEDVLELQTHGSPVLLERLLERVCELGARLARPGEFSERAFLNGKMDLAQAEAVADLIAARSGQAARAALRSLEGEFSRRVDALLAELTTLRAHIEAAIDFPEDEIDFLADPAIGQQLAALRQSVSDLLVGARRGARLARGATAVLIGRPNVGKSSLLNTLAGADRAIVTATPGTTRDALRETVALDGVTLELIDTAGLRDSVDEIERAGVARARAYLAHADIGLLVSDAEHATADLALLDALPHGAARVVLVNKIDVTGATAHGEQRAGVPWLWVSARRGDGLDALRAELRVLAGGQAAADGGTFSARARHVEALTRTAGHLAQAETTLRDAQAGELAAEALRLAQQALGEITGAFYPDDLLGKIFSTFCIGK